MKISQLIAKQTILRGSRGLGHCWALLLLFYLIAVALLDPQEVSNREYLRFVQATGHSPPEYWSNGRFPEGADDDPVVLVNWYEAMSYCRWMGRRLPTVDEWIATCHAGKLIKRGDIWEWTASDIKTNGQNYKVLCGPAASCDCSHRYLPEWKNDVKGFR